MSRVFYNIAHNAVEAMKTKKIGDTFKITVRVENKRVEFRLADNGPGIPQEIRATLFEPFVTYGKSKGTGLGLAIVHKVIQEHQGEIRVEDSPGGGATFVITFPAL